MSYKLAIFDLDGTILDTLDDLTNAVNHTLVSHGKPTRTPIEIRSYLGNGVLKLIERAFPDGTESEIIDHALSEYREYYSSHADIKTKPYDGIKEMLAFLRERGIKTAVLSNKPDAPTKALCKRYFGNLFDCAAGEKEGIPRKPAPDGVYPILDLFGLTSSEAVFIGDSEVDIATAKNAGMDCISVGWGFRDTDILLESGADMIAKDAEELINLIINKQGRNIKGF